MSDDKARLAHRLWAHWSMNIVQEENISQERLDRWQDYWVSFDELPEGVKDTDRELVERFEREEPDYE